MEKIYIGFSYHKGSAVSGAIKLAEGSEYSHVYIRRQSKYGEYVYQASGLSVNFMNIDIFTEHNVILEEYEFELPDDKREMLISFFIKYAGASYALSSLFKLLTIILGKRIGLRIKFKGDGDKTFICSELGAFFVKEILGIEIDQDIDFVTPKDLNPTIKAHGKRVI
jgi:hypothetical protein